MRDIKFKAVIPERNAKIIFTLEDLIMTHLDKSLFSIREILIPWLLAGNVPDRYTGLNDKNGVKIYEGDRIQTVLSDGTRLSTFIIEWDADYARFVTIREQDNDRYYLTAGLSINKEVIGNIHEQESHT